MALMGACEFNYFKEILLSQRLDLLKNYNL